MINTLLDLLKIDSPAKNERAVADYLIRYFSELGLKLIEDNAGERVGGNTGNLYLYIEGSGEPIALLSHMDTVSSTKGLSPLVTDTHIRCNGKTILGADDKVGVTLMCELVKYLARSKTDHSPIELIFTISEEIGLLGIKNIDYKKIKSRSAFVLDSGGPAGTIVTKAPSLERIDIQVNGKSAHAGAEPEKGINAIAIAAKAISSVKQGRVDPETTLNIGTIQGGTATNIVPDKVTIEGEARSFNTGMLDSQVKDLETKFKSAVSESGGSVEFKHRLSFSTFNLDSDSPPVRLAVSAAQKLGINYNITYTGGGSDANILNANGIASVGLGTGVYDAHTDRENVSLNDFYKGLEWLKEIVRR